MKIRQQITHDELLSQINQIRAAKELRILWPDYELQKYFEEYQNHSAYTSRVEDIFQSCNMLKIREISGYYGCFLTEQDSQDLFKPIYTHFFSRKISRKFIKGSEELNYQLICKNYQGQIDQKAILSPRKNQISDYKSKQQLIIYLSERPIIIDEIRKFNRGKLTIRAYNLNKKSIHLWGAALKAKAVGQLHEKQCQIVYPRDISQQGNLILIDIDPSEKIIQEIIFFGSLWKPRYKQIQPQSHRKSRLSFFTDDQKIPEDIFIVYQMRYKFFESHFMKVLNIEQDRQQQSVRKMFNTDKYTRNSTGKMRTFNTVNFLPNDKKQQILDKNVPKPRKVQTNSPCKTISYLKIRKGKKIEYRQCKLKQQTQNHYEKFKQKSVKSINEIYHQLVQKIQSKNVTSQQKNSAVQKSIRQDSIIRKLCNYSHIKIYLPGYGHKKRQQYINFDIEILLKNTYALHISYEQMLSEDNKKQQKKTQQKQQKIMILHKNQFSRKFTLNSLHIIHNLMQQLTDQSHTFNYEQFLKSITPQFAKSPIQQSLSNIKLYLDLVHIMDELSVNNRARAIRTLLLINSIEELYNIDHYQTRKIQTKQLGEEYGVAQYEEIAVRLWYECYYHNLYADCPVYMSQCEIGEYKCIQKIIRDRLNQYFVENSYIILKSGLCDQYLLSFYLNTCEQSLKQNEKLVNSHNSKEILGYAFHYICDRNSDQYIKHLKLLIQYYPKLSQTQPLLMYLKHKNSHKIKQPIRQSINHPQQQLQINKCLFQSINPQCLAPINISSSKCNKKIAEISEIYIHHNLQYKAHEIINDCQEAETEDENNKFFENIIGCDQLVSLYQIKLDLGSLDEVNQEEFDSFKVVRFVSYIKYGLVIQPLFMIKFIKEESGACGIDYCLYFQITKLEAQRLKVVERYSCQAQTVKNFYALIFQIDFTFTLFGQQKSIKTIKSVVISQQETNKNQYYKILQKKITEFEVCLSQPHFQTLKICLKITQKSDPLHQASLQILKNHFQSHLQYQTAPKKIEQNNDSKPLQIHRHSLNNLRHSSRFQDVFQYQNDGYEQYSFYEECFMHNQCVKCRAKNDDEVMHLQEDKENIEQADVRIYDLPEREIGRVMKLDCLEVVCEPALLLFVVQYYQRLLQKQESKSKEDKQELKEGEIQGILFAYVRYWAIPLENILNLAIHRSSVLNFSTFKAILRQIIHQKLSIPLNLTKSQKPILNKSLRKIHLQKIRLFPLSQNKCDNLILQLLQQKIGRQIFALK